MSETVEMYMIVDWIGDDGKGHNADGSLPLTFMTRAEAEEHLGPGQSIMVRDGCPVSIAMVLTRMSRTLAQHRTPRKLESC